MEQHGDKTEKKKVKWRGKEKRSKIERKRDNVTAKRGNTEAKITFLTLYDLLS